MDIFGVDKLYHIGVSILIASSFYTLLVKGARLDERTAFFWVLAVFVPISIGKELIDSLEINNRFDLFDIFANYIGVFIGVILSLPSPTPHHHCR